LNPFYTDEKKKLETYGMFYENIRLSRTSFEHSWFNFLYLGKIAFFVFMIVIGQSQPYIFCIIMLFAFGLYMALIIKFKPFKILILALEILVPEILSIVIFLLICIFAVLDLSGMAKPEMRMTVGYIYIYISFISMIWASFFPLIIAGIQAYNLYQKRKKLKGTQTEIEMTVQNNQQNSDNPHVE